MSYIVVFPKGDKTKLQVTYCTFYKRDDYLIASRKEFDNESDAKIYARVLAWNNGLQFISEDEEDHYLD